MADKKKKNDAVKVAFDLKNGNPTVTVNNILQLLATPVRILLLIALVVLALMFGNLKKSYRAVLELPETIEQVEENTEDIDVLVVWHEEQEELLKQYGRDIFEIKTRLHYARRGVVD